MEGGQEMLLTNELVVAILPLLHIICGLVVWWFDIVAVCGSG